jgi:ketosteroid isomerase-like protein
MSTEEELRAAERRLQAAQLAGDVDALEELLDDRVVGVGPDSVPLGKAEDLETHRTGALRITRFDEEQLDVLVDGPLGVTWVVIDAEGEEQGTPFAGRLRYTRTWLHRHGRWRVLAAHISIVP